MANQTFFTKERLAVLAILLISALVYLPALRGLQILDDHVIASGSAIGGGKSFADCFTHPFLYSYFRPMISATFWLEIHAWGANPFLMHQTNILIHVATTYLIICLAGAFGCSRRVSYLSGLFFALQPAQVGAVAWIGGRTDAQACFFFAVMLLCIARYYRDPKAWWWIPIGVVAGLAAMLTKEQVAPAVLVAPLAGFAFRAPRRQLIAGSAPYLFAGAAFLIVWFLRVPEHLKSPTVSLGEVFSQISRSTLNYTLLFAAPNPWSMNTYSLEALRTPLGVGLGAALSVLIPVGIWRLWKYNAQLGLLAVAGALVYIPVSNLIPIPSLLAAPYRVALSGPCVAILLAVVAGRLWERAADRTNKSNRSNKTYWTYWTYSLGAGAFAVLVAGLGLTYWGATLHKDDVTLFGAATRYDNGSLYMRANYIWALSDKRRTDEALRQSDMLLDQVYHRPDWRNYEAAARIMQEDPHIQQRVLANHGARAEAEPMVSRYFVMHGQLLMKTHRDQEAVRSMRAAIQLDKKDDAAYYGLGHLLLDTDPKEATAELTRAIDLNPNNTGATYMLGHYYATIGDYEKACSTLQRIEHVEKDTGMPLLELADAELRTGRVARARETLQIASHMIVDKTELTSLENRASARS